MHLKTKLIRHWSDFNQSTGTFLVLNHEDQPIFGCLSIERGDRNNQSNVSCVPSGIYELDFEYSNKFRMYLWELKNVPNRSECKIHAANFWDQLNGCISLGLELKKINNDGYYDLTNSKKTIRSFHAIMKGMTKTTIEIIDLY